MDISEGFLASDKRWATWQLWELAQSRLFHISQDSSREKMRLNIIVWAVIGWSCILGTSGAFQRVCYLIGYNGNPNIVLIHPEEMEWKLCTHIIFAFGSSLNGTIHLDNSLVNYIQQMTTNNHSNHYNVKYLLSIAGPDFTFVKSDVGITRYLLTQTKSKCFIFMFTDLSILFWHSWRSTASTALI